MKSSLAGASPVPECREGELFKIINYDALLRHLQIIFERTVLYIACERGELRGSNRRNKISIIGASFRLNHPKSKRYEVPNGRSRNHHRWVDIDNYLVHPKWLCKHIASFVMPKNGRYNWRHHDSPTKVIDTMEELKLIININDNYELTWLKCG